MLMTVAEVEQGLRGFYGAADAGISQVALLGSGFEADVFAFALERGTATEPRALILRLYAGEGAAEKSAREFAAMERLWAAGYPVPQMLALGRRPSPFGRPFVIMERIHGVSLGEAYWSGSEERRQQAQALLYPLIARLHGLDGRAIVPDSPAAASRGPYAFIEHELAALDALHQRLDGRDAPAVQDALAWLHSHRRLVPSDRLTVVHGDFHPNNVLVRADGTPCVIDWSNVRLGDPRMDLAWTRLVTGADSSPDGGADGLRLYEEAAGRAVTNMAYFDAAACTRLLLSVLVSLRSGAARQGMRPEAEEQMRRDASHTRSVAARLQQRLGIPMPALEDALAGLLG